MSPAAPCHCCASAGMESESTAPAATRREIRMSAASQEVANLASAAVVNGRLSGLLGQRQDQRGQAADQRRDRDEHGRIENKHERLRAGSMFPICSLDAIGKYLAELARTPGRAE